MNQYPYMFPTQMSVTQQITRVNGEGGAKAYQMAPNSSVLLLDETAPIVWLKSTDGAGYPNLVPYTITPYEPEPAPDINALIERINRLEEQINAKPDTTSTKYKQSTTKDKGDAS